MLSVAILYCYAECRYAEYHYAQSPYADCRYTECRVATSIALESIIFKMFGLHHHLT
jgi:hypothetical protein